VLSHWETLVNSVWTFVPVNMMLVFVIPCWVRCSVRKAFFWKGKERVFGLDCLVNWDLVCKPKSMGGLGVLNQTQMNKALLAKWS